VSKISQDRLILGTYVHGIFENAAACTELLTWAGLNLTQNFDYQRQRQASIERLAEAVPEHLDTDTLLELLKLKLIQY